MQKESLHPVRAAGVQIYLVRLLLALDEGQFMLKITKGFDQGIVVQ